MYQNNPTKVLTGEVRLSYCNLVTPRASGRDGKGEPRYTVTLLIPKKDTATLKDIRASIEAAAVKGESKLWQGVRPKMSDIVHDGDGTRDDGMPYGAECKGHWVLNAASKMKPQVVGIDNISCELSPQDIYSGMYGRVTINFYPYANGSKGVGCGLGNVLKTRDGEPLAGGASAASDFAGVANEYDPING